MKHYTSLSQYYDHYTESQHTLASPIIRALEVFGEVKLQWNMPVYYRDNSILRSSKNQSWRYFGDKTKIGMLYLGFYDINHFIEQQPQVRHVFDQIQKISGQVWIKSDDDIHRAVALIQLSQSL